MSTPTRRMPLAEAPPAVRLRSCPVYDAWPWSALALAGLAAIGLLVQWSMESIGLALVTMVLLAATVWRFWIPVWFEVDERGITQRFLGHARRIPWHSIGCYEPRAAGIVFQPVARMALLDALAALYVPWQDHREQLCALADHYLGEQRSTARQANKPNTGSTASLAQAAAQGSSSVSGSLRVFFDLLSPSQGDKGG